MPGFKWSWAYANLVSLTPIYFPANLIKFLTVGSFRLQISSQGHMKVNINIAQRGIGKIHALPKSVGTLVMTLLRELSSRT